jgi:NitT/TauT family transport system substrate-binding protein
MEEFSRRRLGRRRQFMTVSAAGALLAVLPVSLRAAPKYGKIDYGIASIDPLYAVAYVTFKNGYFGHEGLEVDYLNTQSGPRTKQVLAAREIFVGTSGVSDAIALSLAGKQASVVFGFDQRVPFANILTHKESFDSGRIRKVQDLAGKTIAVTQPQSATWLMATYIADRAGILKNVTIRGLGDFTTMLGAIKSKQVDAAIATISMMDTAKQQGWGHALFDVSDGAAWNETFGGNVPGVGCYVLADSLTRRADAIAAFVRAMSRGQAVLNESKPEQIIDIIYKDYLGGYDRDATLRAVSVYKNGVWSADNRVSQDSFDRLLKIMGDGRMFSNDEVANVPYGKMVDMTFLDKARKA